MFKKSYVLSGAALALIFTIHPSPVCAQGAAPTGWEVNQQSRINQEAASGIINTQQAGRLENREAQIQQQQQQYMNQNGGTLTQGEQRQIDSELRGVNQHMGRDVRHDMQNNPNMMNQLAPMMQGNPNAAWPMQRPWPNNFGQAPFNGQFPVNQGQMQMPMVNQQASQWPNQQFQNQQNPEQFGHHHHHGQFGGGFNGANGFTGGSNVNGGNGWSGGNNMQGRNWGGNGP
jgi:hypothetical protein